MRGVHEHIVQQLHTITKPKPTGRYRRALAHISISPDTQRRVFQLQLGKVTVARAALRSGLGFRSDGGLIFRMQSGATQ